SPCGAARDEPDHLHGGGKPVPVAAGALRAAGAAPAAVPRRRPRLDRSRKGGRLRVTSRPRPAAPMAAGQPIAPRVRGDASTRTAHDIHPGDHSMSSRQVPLTSLLKASLLGATLALAGAASAQTVLK